MAASGTNDGTRDRGSGLRGEGGGTEGGIRQGRGPGPLPGEVF